MGAVYGIIFLITFSVIVSLIVVFFGEGFVRWMAPDLRPTSLNTKNPIVLYVLWCERFWYGRKRNMQ